MKIFLSALATTFLIGIYAQKNLTLEEAVMGQYQQFKPKSIFDFNWVPDTDDYSYLESYTNLMYANVKEKKADTILTIKDVNETLDVKFQYFSGFKWKNKTSFYLTYKNQVILFDYKNKSGEKVQLKDNAENIELDPESGQIVYTVDNNIQYANFNGDKVTITDFEDKNIVSGQAIARSEFGISGGLFWSPKAEKLAFYQKDETKVHDYPLLDINEYPGKLNSIKYPMAGQPSEKAKVGIYSIESKKTFYIETRSGEESYLTNLSWTPDGKFIILAEVNRDQNHMWLQKYNSKGEFIKTLFEEKKETWVEPERPAFFLSDDSDQFVWVSERDGFDNLYLYDIEGKLIKQLTENRFVLKDILTSNTKGEIFFTATGKNPLNTLLFKVDLKGKQSLITPEEGTHQIKIQETNNHIFDAYSSHDTPGITVIRNAKGKIVNKLIEAGNPLADYHLSEAEVKAIETEDGLKLYTRLIKPKDFDPNKKYPVLFYVYGGPHAQLITNSWLDGGSLWMHWMANQGYLVFTLDNRGSGNRGVYFEHGIHRQLGTLELEDQLRGVEYLKTLPFVDQDRFAVHGWSFGGFMTGTMMTKAADVFKVGVAGGPVTDWKYYEIMYGERYMDRPQDNEDGYKTSSLIENADKLEGDLLLIHGTSDNVVVMQHNLALIKKFVSLGKQVDFFPYPMHEHNVYGKDRVHLMEKVLTYVLENN
ncbi:MAG: DPP IV N-terminal domain-containing protein [Brumimicrobium sp.]